MGLESAGLESDKPMPEDFELDILSTRQFVKLKQCYRRWGEKIQFKNSDRAYVLRRGEHLCAALRCAALRLQRKTPERWFLRNLCVDPSYRRRGLARKLLRGVIALLNLDEQCYCFALAQLEQFYLEQGFEVMPVPESVRDSFRRCQKQQPLVYMEFVKRV